MSLWILFQRWAIRRFNQLNSLSLLFILTIYLFLSWTLLFWAKEVDLTSSLTNFIYYLVVTASTVGYGDMSPQTTAGKWIAALFVIPAGLGLFAIVIGRIASSFILYWKKGLMGQRKVKVKNHLLILGWNGQRTLHLVKMLQYEIKGDCPIVLCVQADIENPLPGEVEFVRVNNFTDIQGMQRACVDTAQSIIIDNPKDDITFTAALFCASKNKLAHILVYFNDESLGQLLKMHYPRAECIPSVSVEMLAKSAIDPGSSVLHHELLSTHKGMTQYSVIYPNDQPKTSFEALFTYFKKQQDAILIAIDKGKGVEVNPRLSTPVIVGDKIFYIADERLCSIQWPFKTE